MTQNGKNYERVTRNTVTKRENENNDYQHGRSIGSSSILSGTSRARANKKEFFIDPDTMDEIEQYYEENLGYHMPSVILRQIVTCLADGMDPLLIPEAIDQTMLAPRPSAQYLQSILRRWYADGIRTCAQQVADSERHQAELSARYTRRWRKTLDHEGDRQDPYGFDWIMQHPMKND